MVSCGYSFVKTARSINEMLPIRGPPARDRRRSGDCSQVLFATNTCTALPLHCASGTSCVRCSAVLREFSRMGKEKFVQIREIRGPKSAEWADAKMWVITADANLTGAPLGVKSACGAMAESADATDLKSVGGDTVWVRPPLALLELLIPAGTRPGAPVRRLRK